MGYLLCASKRCETTKPNSHIQEFGWCSVPRRKHSLESGRSLCVLFLNVVIWLKRTCGRCPRSSACLIASRSSLCVISKATQRQVSCWIHGVEARLGCGGGECKHGWRRENFGNYSAPWTGRRAISIRRTRLSQMPTTKFGNGTSRRRRRWLSWRLCTRALRQPTWISATWTRGLTARFDQVEILSKKAAGAQKEAGQWPNSAVRGTTVVYWPLRLTRQTMI